MAFSRGLAPLAYLLLAAAPLAAQAPLPNEIDPPGAAKPSLTLDAGGHTNAVYKLLPSTYADELISVSLDKTVRFWDPNSGEPRAVLRTPIGPGPQGFLFCASMSPDGKLLAVSGYRAQTPLYDHRIHLVAWPEGRIVHSLKGHAYAVYDVAFSPDGQRLASASHDGTVRVWNAASGDLEKTLKGHTAIVHAVAWSPDGKRLVSGGFDNTARIWSAASGASEAVLREPRGRVNTVAWSPDGRTVAAGGVDKSIRLYEPSGKLRYTWPSLPNEVLSIAFSPDSQRLLYTFGSNSQAPPGAAVLELKDGRESRRYMQHPNSAICGCWIQGGKLVATGDSVSGIHLWDPTTGATVRKLLGRGRSVVSAGWSADGQALAWGNSPKDATIDYGGSLERTFCLRRLEFGPPPDKTFSRAKNQLGPLRIGVVADRADPNRRHAVGIARSGAVISRFELPNPDDHVRSYSLLMAGEAVVGTDATAYIFDVNTGLPRRQLADRGGEVSGVAPSADFRYVLIASNDQMLKAWNVASGELLLSLFVAGDDWIAWTPQGYYAASFAGENLMGWHINNGPEQLASFYSAAQFHKSLYRPDVIRRVIEVGEVARSLEIADRERESQSRPLMIADVLPPKVRITSPTVSQIDVPKGSLTIAATAEAVDSDPVTAMRLIVDGRPWGPAKPIAAPRPDQSATPASADASPTPATEPPARGADPPAPEPAIASWSLELPPGKHMLRVKAETADSYALSPALEARGDGESPAPGKLHVLSIGAAPDHGGGGESSDAASARTIAQSVRDAGAAQFSSVDVHELADRAATPDAVAKQFDALERTATSADTTIVILAGPVQADPVQANSVDARFLSAPAPAGNAGLPGGDAGAGLSGQELKSRLARIPGHVALVLDARRQEQQSQRRASSGFCGAAEEDSENRTDVALAELLRSLLTEDYGVAVIGALRTSASAVAPNPPGGSSSSTVANPNPSALSRALEEGLGGKADADHDGVIQFGELGSYVAGRVREITSKAVTTTIERPAGMTSFPLGGIPTQPAAKP